MRLDDPLGHLVPPGQISAADIQRALVGALERRSFPTNDGRRAIPTRYVVRLGPADRAWLTPDVEDILARTLEVYAAAAGHLRAADIRIELVCDAGLPLGRMATKAVLTEKDLALVADPDLALEVFARH